MARIAVTFVYRSMTDGRHDIVEATREIPSRSGYGRSAIEVGQKTYKYYRTESKARQKALDAHTLQLGGALSLAPDSTRAAALTSLAKPFNHFRKLCATS